nr:PREDICTED: protein ANKUB1 isoform X3 [Anolis carolinensis]|eukprot:XP_008104392.1 PREDICTED: protein ANKUB1 isoform X3 [Anolis carolinensis]
MRIFVAFEGLCESFDISSEDTVKDVKQMIKEENKPILYVCNAVTHEKVPIMGRMYLLSSKVSQLKNLVTLKTGFPSSIYCLRTQEGREMYDCNTLSDYQLDIGATLHLDVWDGWKEFLTGCVLGNTPKVRRYLSKEEPVLKYQRRVALYMAAFFGHLQLSAWLLKKSTKPTEPIGVHPYREWCHENSHPDITKCPVHAAAEAGQLVMLKAFVNFSALCLECQNSAGQTPLQLCIQHRHKDCVLYLVTKIWSVVSCPNFSLPMKIYIKLKLWLLQAQKNIHRKKRRIQTATFRTRVGDVVLVDGFTKSKMTSRSLYSSRVKDVDGRGCKLPSLNDQFQHEEGSHSRISKRHFKGTNVKLPPVIDGNKRADMHKRQQKKSNKRKKRPLSSADYMDQHMCLARVPLPPGPVHKPSYYYSIPNAKFLLKPSLASFSEHSGRTPRENAIYCLAIASSFKEKPWLQQLNIARTLAKKSICKAMY